MNKMLLLCLGWNLAAATPEPVAIWPASPMEVRVAFADPAPAALAEGAALVGKGPDAPLRIAAARWLDEGRTLALAVDPHPRDGEYVLSLRGPGGEAITRSYGLRGVVATWREGEAADDPDAEPLWKGWLPGLDPRASRQKLRGSVEHERAFGRIGAGAGVLTLETLLPPGEGAATALTLVADVPFRASFGFDAEAESAPRPDGKHAAELKAENADGLALPLTVVLKGSGNGEVPSLSVTGCDPNRLGLLWAPAALPATDEAPEPPFPLEGGDPARGREVFVGEVVKCAACHRIGGEGGQVGPELDVLRRHDLPWIYNQIAAPSAEILPDYQTYSLVLKDGRVLSGVVRAEGFDEVRVLDHEARQVTARKSEIAEFQPSSTSVMPQGLAAAVGEQGMRDLLAYLTAKRPGPEPRD